MTRNVLPYATPTRPPHLLHFAGIAGPRNARRNVEIPGRLQWGQMCPTSLSDPFNGSADGVS